MAQASMRSEFPATQVASKVIIELGREVLRAEQKAIAALTERIDESFSRAVDKLLACRGCVIVTGIGKAGIIAQKVAASLSSTGTPSYFLHPTEAVHGDVGCIRNVDIVLLLSNSGETEEITRLLPIIRQSVASTIAITAHERSTLASSVELALLIGHHPEACPLGLAPSCSTTAMLALGDALALVVSQQRGFTREQFARFHPGGGLGKKLTRVEEVMRPLIECRLALDTQSVREVLIHVGRPGRRTGAIMLTDGKGALAGIFTDSDLARLLESCHEAQLDRPVAEVMTRKLQTVTVGCYLPDAMRILAERKISELPVVTVDYRPLGIVDITDVMSVMSELWSMPDRSGQTNADSPEDGSFSPSSNGDCHILPISAHRPVTSSRQEQHPRHPHRE